MSNMRLIDKQTSARTDPIRILLLSLPHPRTTSLTLALQKLGYTPYSMHSLLKSPSQFPCWSEAIKTTCTPLRERPKARRSLPPYTRADYDKLIPKDMDVLADIPAAILAQDLIAAYPDAKVIISAPEYTSWETYMRKTLYPLLRWRVFVTLRYFNISAIAPFLRLLHAIFSVHSGNAYIGPDARRAYEAHYAKIRERVPASQLLELSPDETSWEPLCEFLGKAVPKSERFPNVDPSLAMERQMMKTWWSMLQYLVLVVLVPGLMVLGGIVAFFYRDEVLRVVPEYVESWRPKRPGVQRDV